MTRLMASGEVLLRLSPPGRTLLPQTPSPRHVDRRGRGDVATQLAILGL